MRPSLTRRVMVTPSKTLAAGNRFHQKRDFKNHAAGWEKMGNRRLTDTREPENAASKSACVGRTQRVILAGPGFSTLFSNSRPIR